MMLHPKWQYNYAVSNKLHLECKQRSDEMLVDGIWWEKNVGKKRSEVTLYILPVCHGRIYGSGMEDEGDGIIKYSTITIYCAVPLSGSQALWRESLQW